MLSALLFLGLTEEDEYDSPWVGVGSGALLLLGALWLTILASSVFWHTVPFNAIKVSCIMGCG